MTGAKAHVRSCRPSRLRRALDAIDERLGIRAMEYPVPEHANNLAWSLGGVTAAGSLSAALAAPAGALTGLRVTLSGLVLLTAVALAARVMVIVERARRRAGGDPCA